MHKRNASCFVVVDRNKKLFNVIEGVGNVGVWNRKVVERQSMGADVYGLPSLKSKNTLVQEYQERFGYTYTTEPVLSPSN
ncbi:hypothetical protein [Paenibacillus sp. VMFN-D1]|uniref:hypothetical protein n=1 Tax=Paenibacillus sp. VMFN-D1 TaxID=2135608 RepID=UPI000E256D65|nr:hypothetical protein [Paenibacillus sp. VMFN-D1]RED34686.1 hypothetical protein C7820_4349 [Paenibacillus sp. VMFN-D1]